MSLFVFFEPHTQGSQLWKSPRVSQDPEGQRDAEDAPEEEEEEEEEWMLQVGLASPALHEEVFRWKMWRCE